MMVTVVWTVICLTLPNSGSDFCLTRFFIIYLFFFLFFCILKFGLMIFVVVLLLFLYNCSRLKFMKIGDIIISMMSIIERT